MLGLKLPTDPRWTKIAEKSIEEILVDHAYCEQKAATSCITLIVGNPERKKLVDTLAPIVTEEWGHFRMVMEQLEKRGLTLSRPRKDEYVLQLASKLKGGGSREEQLVEKLLLNAMIEARSCERFRLLSQDIADEELKEFYHQLMISEAGHYRTFLDLAQEYYDPEKVKARFDELLEEEAKIIAGLELRGDRVH